MTVEHLGARLRSGATTARDLADRALSDADRHDTFVLVTAELARAAATTADQELAAGIDRGPLHGIPVAVKDVVDVAGLPTRGGTAGCVHRTPTADAPAWRALREAGAVLIGKTRLPELALDVVTSGTVNPRDPGRVSGGSSGGSAAAVAGGVVPLALGTDTGGSVRIPAALTGVTGLRPTYGAVSTDGVLPLSPSQDTVGVLGAHPRDCLLGYEALRGPCPPGPVDPPAQRPLRIGVPDHLWRGAVADPVAAAFARSCAVLADLGHEVRDCEVPLADTAPAISYLLMIAEAAAAWPEPLIGISDRVARQLAAGRDLPAAERQGARELAAEIRMEMIRLLTAELDLVALPTTAATAVPVGAEDTVCGGRREPIAAAYLRFTTLASVCGLPAISVPCGAGDGRLPVGLQLVAAPYAERLLCRVAGEVADRGPAG